MSASFTPSIERLPGAELGYAEILADFTTTNTDITAGDPPAGSTIGGLSVAVTGTGRPVDVELNLPLVRHSVANTPCLVYITVDGHRTGNVSSVSSTTTTAGRGLIVKRRLVIPAGVTRTFGVCIAGGAAGTVTVTASESPAYVPSLTVTAR